jgi:hypothetical protein
MARNHQGLEHRRADVGKPYASIRIRAIIGREMPGIEDLQTPAGRPSRLREWGLAVALMAFFSAILYVLVSFMRGASL